MSKYMDPYISRRNRSFCLAVSHCLAQYGSSRLDLLNQSMYGKSVVEIYFDGGWSFCVDARYVPFVLGVCHGLSNKDLCRIITSLSIDPITFIRDFGCLSESIVLPDKTRLTGMSFSTKMLDLFFELDAEAALASMKTHLGDTQVLTAAFLASGHVGGLLSKMVNDECLAAYCDEDIDSDTVQSVVSCLPFNLTSFDHFPGGSVDEYLMSSAAFNGHILRKTLSNNGYWEHIFAAASKPHLATDCCKAILEHVFSHEFSATHKKKLELMLSNVVMEFAEPDYEHNELFSEILRLVEQSAVADFANKTIFHLSLLRGCLDYDVPPVSLCEVFNDAQLSHPRAIGMLHRLIALDDHLFEQVIKETLSLERHCIGYHLLSLPFALKALTLPKQTVESGLFEQYLVTMAEAASHYTTENDSLGVKQDMDFAIHEGMAHWFQYLSSSQPLDTGLLTRGSEQACEQLVRWGLDIHSLPAPSDKAMSFSLERDLGL